MRYVTIKDIAQKLNISISTVSRAFNDKYDIKPETRELILQTAKEMGYRPNPIARKLIQQRSFNIGVVVPEFINAFFPEVIIGIQEVLLEKNYQVLIMQSNECFETEQKNIKTLEDNMVDGIIISLTSESCKLAHYKELVEQGFPLVLFNRVNDEINAPKVVFDDYKWSFFATEHLIQQGYKDIIHLAGPEKLTLSKNRIKGFIDAHKKHHLSLNSSNIIPTGFTIEKGETIAQELIDKNRIPEAIFCVADPVAIGVMKVFKHHGIKIPQDVAIMGFTESKLAPLVEPPLSSVSQPTFEMGKAAAQLMLDLIDGKTQDPPPIITLNGQLKIRESTTKYH